MIAFVSQRDKNIAISQLTPLIREAAYHSFVELEQQISVFIKFRNINGVTYKIQGGIKNIDKTIRKITNKHNKRSKHFIEFLVISTLCYRISKDYKTAIMINNLDKKVKHTTLLAAVELKQLRKFLKQNTVNKSFFYMDKHHPERLVLYPGNQDLYISDAYMQVDTTIGFFIGESISLYEWTDILTQRKKINRIYVADGRKLDKHYLWFFNNQNYYRSTNRYIGPKANIVSPEPSSIIPINYFKNSMSYSSKTRTCEFCPTYCTNTAFIGGKETNICSSCLKKLINKALTQPVFTGKE